ncbi:MAG: alpha/beta hydrolase [Cyanobacteria bacterium]|jgi:pimeloyl-ACP methyl ester carboxylesterase|nr:alpha/beta hydrolase [Cyanobacteria bacterium GSL.Bin21]
MNNRRQIQEENLVSIPVHSIRLQGNLSLPKAAQGIVLFAHGSGSSRYSPRNRFVAEVLQKGGLGTLLIDLLTEEEEAIDLQTRQLRFNINLLAKRLAAVTDWLLQNEKTRLLPIGYFGASTGAAAALVAATQHPQFVKAIVSRGERPDLAGSILSQIQAPTLLIVGGNDVPVIEMNQFALAQLQSEKQLKIVPRATHLFEEAGALEEVARLAREWFQYYLT